MGEIDEVLKEVEQLARRMVPSCFEVESIELTPTDPNFPSPTPFTILARIVRRNDEPEPAGWAQTFTTHIRTKWGQDDFQLAIRIEVNEAGGEA